MVRIAQTSEPTGCPCVDYQARTKVTNRCRHWGGTNCDLELDKKCILKGGRWGEAKEKFKAKAPKGSPFERETLKTLSLWWSEGEEDDIFWRTPGSGARATNRSKRTITTSNAYGDLAASDERGVAFTQLCVVEMKRGYKQWSPLDSLDKKPKMKPQVLEQFWKQVVDDCEKAGGREPIMIFRRDQRDTCIIITQNLLNHALDYCGKSPDNRLVIRLDTIGDGLFCFRLEDFLNWCSPQFFMRYATERGKI